MLRRSKDIPFSPRKRPGGSNERFLDLISSTMEQDGSDTERKDHGEDKWDPGIVNESFGKELYISVRYRIFVVFSSMTLQ